MADLLNALVEATGLRGSDILKIALTAPIRYKKYTIPKRDGGRRPIAQPARDTKFLQRALMDVLLSKLPIHAAATAYRRGLSIRHNALPHAQSGPILKLDLRDFFPSIRARDWRNYCQTFGVLTDEGDIRLSEQLLFFKQTGRPGLRLSIGAPSSPMLSNVLMFQFDDEIAKILAKDKVIYTRYADDMTFSAPRTGHLIDVKKEVARLIRRTSYPRLDLNDKKTVYATKKYHRGVTGLTLANDGRVTVGYERKRRLRAGVHGAKAGTLSLEATRELAGQLAYVNSVEPEFINKLRTKYGEEILKFISQIAAVT